ncbi:MAG: hypothetical protein C0423_14345 [Methylibium sp.]|nr:hypothetical protein [Methylibium sp.]
MIKTTEDLIALPILIVLFCPALFGLLMAFVSAKRGKVADDDLFTKGVFLHVLNALLSPGVPTYLLYLDLKTGGGSVASLLSLPIIPITWLLYFVARRRINKAIA